MIPMKKFDTDRWLDKLNIKALKVILPNSDFSLHNTGFLASLHCSQLVSKIIIKDKIE